MSSPSGSDDFIITAGFDDDDVEIGLDDIASGLEATNALIGDLADQMSASFSALTQAIQETALQTTATLGPTTDLAAELGLTQQTVVDLAAELGLLDNQANIYATDVAHLNEVLAAGSEAQLAANRANAEAAEQLSALTNEYGGVVIAGDRLTAVLQEQSGVAIDFKSSYGLAYDAVDRLLTRIQSGEATLSTFTDDLDHVNEVGLATAQAMQGVGTSFLFLDEQTAALATSLQLAGASFQLFGDVASIVNPQINAFVSADERMAAAADVASASLLRQQGALSGVGTSASLAAAEGSGFGASVGGAIEGLASKWFLLGLGVTALVRFGASAITAGSDFSAQMALVQNLASNASDNIAQLTQQILASAVPWRQTPAALAEGLYYVMSAGFHGADVMKILQQSAYAASGGLGSLSDMTKAVTNLLTDYNLKGSDAALVTNAMISAVVQGKTTVDQFAAALAKVAPTAGALGVNMTAVFSAFDTLTRTGRSATSSATYLNQILLQLGYRGETVAASAAGMGISLNAAHLQTLITANSASALADTLKYVSSQVLAWADAGHTGADAAARYNTAMLTLLGGVRSGTGAIALTSDQMKSLNGIIGALSSSTIDSASHFSAMTSTLASNISAIGVAWNTFWTKFDIQHNAVLIRAAQAITNLITKFGDFASAHPEAVTDAFIALATVLGGLFATSLLSAGAKMLGLTALLKGELPGSLRMLSGLFGTFGSGAEAGFIGPLTEAQTYGTGFIGTLSRLASGMSGFGRSIGTAVEDGVRHFADLPERAIASLDGLARAGGRAALTFGQGLLGGIQAIPGLLRTGVASIYNVLTDIPGTLATIGSSIAGLGSSALEVIPALVGMGAAILPILAIVLAVAGAIALGVLIFTRFRTEAAQVGAALFGALRPALESIHQTVETVVTGIEQRWSEMWPKIRPAVEGFLNSLKSLAPTVAFVGQVIATVFKVIVAVIAGALSAFIGVLPQIINVFSGVIRVIGDVGNIVATVFNPSKWNQIPALFVRLFGDILGTVGNAVHVILGFIGGLVGGILQWLNKLLGDNPVVHFVQMVIGWFQHLFDVLLGHSIVPDLIMGVIRFFAMLPAQIPLLVLRATLAVLSHFADLAPKAESAIAGMAAGVIARVTQMGRGMLSALQNLPSEFASLGGQIVQGLANGIRNSAGSALSALGGLKDNILSHVKGLFGISSPSRVFADFGMSMMQGLAQGIANNHGLVHSTLNTLRAQISGFTIGGLGVGVGGVGGARFGAGVGGIGGGFSAPGGNNSLGSGSSQNGSMVFNGTFNLHGGIAAAFQLMSASERAQFADTIATQMSKHMGLQGRVFNGSANANNQ